MTGIKTLLVLVGVACFFCCSDAVPYWRYVADDAPYYRRPAPQRPKYDPKFIEQVLDAYFARKRSAKEWTVHGKVTVEGPTVTFPAGSCLKVGVTQRQSNVFFGSGPKDVAAPTVINLEGKRSDSLTYSMTIPAISEVNLWHRFDIVASIASKCGGIPEYTGGKSHHVYFELNETDYPYDVTLKHV